MATNLKDLLLPLAVVAVVGMMVFPLPPALLDVLLMLNIAFALVLLINSVYLAEPEKFTSLPSILLLTTLFRLGLNISTTRQILATGTAPDVVTTFGHFVVGGNLVVGIVVFCIITLVQFVVIAKGAERVAEVAARFTLDAMPGKQMSIDADVRAGVISLNEARERRVELHRESKLFGALDGAIKFVKGDAIAGLIITVVNICGGLVVGVTQQNLSFYAAMQKYTIFTIGDGLASQIPALLISVAAGIAVTRVGDKSNSFIGRDVLSQVVREPQALGTAAAVLFGLGLVPGLPLVPFLAMSGVVAATGLKLKRQISEQHKNQESSRFNPKVNSALLLRLSNQAALILKQEKTVPALYQSLRNRIFEKRGFLLPDLQFELDLNLSGESAELAVRGVTLCRYQRHESGKSFSEEIVLFVEEAVLKYKNELIDDTQTRMLLEIHQSVAGDIINSLVPTTISVTALTLLLRALVDEDVNIKEMGQILQAVAEFYLDEDAERILAKSRASSSKYSLGDRATCPEDLLARVRLALSRQISKVISNEQWYAEVLMLAPSIDHLLSRLARSGTPINPALADALVERIKQLQEESAMNVRVVVTSVYARLILSTLLRNESIEMVVVAAEELAAQVQLKIFAELGVPGLAAVEAPSNLVNLQAEAA